MIRFEQVSKAYFGGRQALQGVDFHLRPAEMAFLVGHSGAGKSTLLKLICGIERPSAGHILFGGHDISRLKKREIPFLRRQIGIIFQDHHLLMDRTVYDNVAMPLVIAGSRMDDIRRRVSVALDKVGLLDKARNFPVQLSCGEQQRTGIARAVVNKPALLLADEPTGNLDNALSEGILCLFEEFKCVGMTRGGIAVSLRSIREEWLGKSMANKFKRPTLDNNSAKPLRSQTAGKVKLANSKALRGGWKHQWRHAWLDTLADMGRQPLSTLLTVVVIAISLTLPSLCYLVWKNVSQAAELWYPTPQLTVYLDKVLNDDAAMKVISILKQEDGVAKVNYLLREEAISEFRNWSGFGGVVDILEENPLPAVAIITPKINAQSAETLKMLHDRVAAIHGVNEVRMDYSWFARLPALTGLVGKVSGIIGILMLIAVFMVIGNSIRLSIFSRRDTINVMKLIGATDGFILRPFLNYGVLLGQCGAVLSLILSATLVWQLESVADNVATVFSTTFVLHGLSWDEDILLLLISSMIGWLAAWLATVQHLHRFTTD